MYCSVAGTFSNRMVRITSTVFEFIRLIFFTDTVGDSNRFLSLYVIMSHVKS